MTKKFLLSLLLLFMTALPALAAPKQEVSVPILLYHRLGPKVTDGMTIKTSVFEEHLKYLRDNGYKVIPLRQLINWYQHKGPAPGPKSVVITSDDGHKSIYTYMFPIVKKYRVPVTLFIYPSAISNAKYAMTWDQLRTLKNSGLFDFQSHTFWHPNFKKERKRLKPADFDKFVTIQFTKSKEKIEKELGVKVDMLAWPFGIYDNDLMKRASAAGYIAAFTIEAHHATAADNMMKLPRYLLINSDQGKSFAKILSGTAPKRNIVY
ncbi:MAG: polysaccharide deacetylase family protein [Desulfuromonadales bacterium]|nr:polysaccharide deacetylase family protein [Desulfuromonadales bacterium]